MLVSACVSLSLCPVISSALLGARFAFICMIAHPKQAKARAPVVRSPRLTRSHRPPIPRLHARHDRRPHTDRNHPTRRRTSIHHRDATTGASHITSHHIADSTTRWSKLNLANIDTISSWHRPNSAFLPAGASSVQSSSLAVHSLAETGDQLATRCRSTNSTRRSCNLISRSTADLRSTSTLDVTRAHSPSFNSVLTQFRAVDLFNNNHC
jgi:hypothetical protein